jgi:RNA polymerase sigma factor (sigma-70 family)
MHLTAEQQRLAEQAMEIVPKAIAAFRRRYPSLRRQANAIDATSVAYLAICKAAVTYNPAKSKVTTYFSMAIRNALLKEIDRNRRLRYDSPDRVSMEVAEAVAAGKQRVLSTKIQAAIARLPAKSRRLIHLRFFRGLSLREIGEQVGCDPRTIQRRLAVALGCLETLLQSEPLVP